MSSRRTCIAIMLKKTIMYNNNSYIMTSCIFLDVGSEVLVTGAKHEGRRRQLKTSIMSG